MDASGAAVGKARIFGTVVVLNVVAAFSLAMFIGPQGTLRFGLFAAMAAVLGALR
jgi:hypothetical protein